MIISIPNFVSLLQFYYLPIGISYVWLALRFAALLAIVVGEYLLFPLCVPLVPIGSYPGWLFPLLPAAGDVPFVAAAVMLVQTWLEITVV